MSAMKPSKGYYSLIQYCPDLGRLEAANVGVLLFAPEREFVKALTSTGNSRIIGFFGSKGHDWRRINSFKKGLEKRLKIQRGELRNLADLEKFIALRANFLQITAPRPMKVLDPEEDLQRLFEELVGARLAGTPRKSLQKLLSDKFVAAGVDSKIRRDIPIKVPVLEKEVEIPFGYQNGRFNLIQPVPFQAADPDRIVATACKYAIEGHELYRHAHPKFGELQLVVLGSFRSRDDESPRRVKRVFEDYNVKLFREDQVPELIDEIHRTGKELKPLTE